MSSTQIEKIYNAILKIGRFPKQTRYNIRNNSDVAPRGAVFGLIKLRNWVASVKDTDLYPSKLSFYPKYTELYRLLEELMWDYDPSFKFTSIQVNDNQLCAKHKDTNNVGVSYIIGVGNYEGGELRVWNDNGTEYEDIDIHNKFISFDGSKRFHQTLPFTGNRYTIIYYIV
jgi:hypothetical protein